MKQEGQREPYEGWDFAGMQFIYATNFVSTNTNREFLLTFGCFSPDELESKKVRCVARIVIGPEHMMELITVLRTQFEAFQKMRRGEGGEEGEIGFRK